MSVTVRVNMRLQPVYAVWCAALSNLELLCLAPDLICPEAKGAPQNVERHILNPKP